MEHYGIIKRMKHEIQPKWCETVSGNFEPVKYENIDFYSNTIYFQNVIFNQSINSILIDYWKGTIKQSLLVNSEVLIIEDEKLVIEKLEKNIDGTIVYYVNDYSVKVENYDKLLEECDVLFDNYNEILKQELNKSEHIEVKLSWFDKFIIKFK